LSVLDTAKAYLRFFIFVLLSRGSGRKADLARFPAPQALHTGRVLNLSGIGFFSVVRKDLIDPATCDTSEAGNFIGFNSLTFQGDNQLPAFLVKTARRWNPKNAGMMFLNLLEQLSREDVFGIGVFLNAHGYSPLSSTTAAEHPGCET
jgi:hypothetical protein